MRRNPEFVLCDVAGKHILMPAGKQAANLNGMVTLNDVGVSVWNVLEKDTTFDELLEQIMNEYEVTEERASADLVKYLASLRSFNGILD